jgi:hypothetical protein
VLKHALRFSDGLDTFSFERARPMYYTQITIFHVFALLGIIGGLDIGFVVGHRFFGLIGGLVLAIAGAVLGYIIALIPEHISHRSMFKEIEKSSNEQLWKIVNMGWWNFYQTIALLQLAARGQDVRSRLPRILDMLESDNRLTRLYGWDALRVVFTELVPQAPDYNPSKPPDECKRNIAQLRRSLWGPTTELEGGREAPK